jgi:hypothetical protein
VSAHERQQPLREHEPDDRRRDHRPEAAENETTRPDRDGKTDVATDEIECAVSEIDDPEQAENQREPAGHDEQKRSKRQPIEEL